MPAPAAPCRRRAALAGLACALLALHARAQTEHGVQLSIADCAGVASSEITRLLELELAPRSTDASGNALRATLRCAATHATISVEDGRRPSPLVLELELRETKPEARPRFLALAIAELIATSRLETGARPASPATRAANQAANPAAIPAAVPAQDDSPVRRARAYQFFLEAGAARADDPARFAPTIALGAARHFAPFALGVDVAYQRAALRTTLASVSAWDLSLRVAPEWHPVRAAALDVGLALGLRTGYAQLSATSRSADLRGRTLSGLFVAPLAGASLTASFTRAFAARIALELGYVVKPVRGFDAEGKSLLDVSGMRLAALLGVVWTP